VTDHHIPMVDVNAIVINPHKSKLDFKELSGAFTAYKLLEAFVLYDIEEFRKEYVVFDIETTGLSIFFDEIVEIAGVKLKNMIKVDEFSVTVKSKVPISLGAYEVNKISNTEIENGVTTAEAINKFIEFAGTAELIAHNLEFDVAFLNKAFSALGYDFNFIVHDLIEFSRKLLPLRNISLSTMAYELGFDVDVKHRALEDAKLTADIFSKLFFITNPKIRYLREKFSELIGLSIISDSMPVIKENRSCLYVSIKKLKNPSNKGLNELLKNYIGKRSIDEEDLAYYVVPVLNSCGRLGEGMMALKLLTDFDDKLIELIDEINNKRKKLQDKCFDEFKKELYKVNDIDKDSILVAVAKDLPRGILGVIASRFANSFKKPVILLIDDGSSIVGSSRSYGGFDMLSLLSKLEAYLERYGGHRYACGLAVKRDYLTDFINEIKSVKIDKSIASYDVEIDELDSRIYSELRFLKPFGYRNENPVFFMREVNYSVDNGLVLFKKKGKFYRGLNLTKLKGSGVANLYFTINDNNIEVIYADS
ncbi:MAG: exonuclease domain-containing protein, partial [bacterium]|nr:exonuclease domain-containing protein [bacterium]